MLKLVAQSISYECFDFSVLEQVVWKATTKIGAAGKTRADGSFIVVVRYSPPGNLVAENSFRENVLPSESWQPPTEAGVVQTSSNFVFIITGLLFSSVFQ